MKTGIYKILNKLNDKVYVGSAVNFSLRWSQHKSRLKVGDHPNRYLQSSFNKNGLENFEFVILERCDREVLIEREQFWINELKACDREFGYNTRSIANSNIGVRCSEETKKKLSKIFTGRILSAETKAKMSAWQVGRKMSKEAKLNMALSTRNFDKWPHDDGAFCKCGDCTKQRTDIHREHMKKKKIEKGMTFVSDHIQAMLMGV